MHCIFFLGKKVNPNVFSRHGCIGLTKMLDNMLDHDFFSTILVGTGCFPMIQHNVHKISGIKKCLSWAYLIWVEFFQNVILRTL